MATFYNQATLSFNGRLTNSNITEGETLNVLSASKTALSSSYGLNDSVVYLISIVNSGNTPYTGLTVTDTLGAYTLGNMTIYPLDYVEGSIRYFVNGTEADAPDVTAGPPLVITGISVPAGGNATVIYEARTNEFTPLAAGSAIVNRAVISGESLGEDINVNSTVTAAEDTILTIAKAICPAVVTEDGQLTYTFVIQNSGNAPAVATDDVIVTDTFNPILQNLDVTYNGEEWTEGINYTYSTTTGEFATLPGQITVPAATYSRDAETGVVTVTPGVAVITVTGTI